jgi:serine/threonine-protein kinase
MDGMAELDSGDEFAGCRIEAVAGRGGMGVVYRATQLGLGRPVALKLLAADHAGDPDFRERFQRESRMAAAIDHPNVIPVYAAGEEDGRLYLVMRYVGGTDLHALLRSGGALEPGRAADIVSQVAAALDAAHRAGLVHRDVKPANVLLGGEHAYLSDFGLTRVVGSDTSITETGHWIGTVDYCSPEQLGGGPIDARADVYSLGCVLYAALTGAPPFHRGTVPATMAAQLHDPPPRPSESGAPREFDRVIARALAKDPDDRYPSAGDLGRAARAAARGEPVTESERSVARGPAAPGSEVNGRPANGLWANGADPADDATKALDGGAPEHATTPLTAATSAATAFTRFDPLAYEEPAAARSDRARLYRSRGLLRSALVALAVVATLAAVGLALSAVLGSGPGSSSSGPLSADDVRGAAQSFADAYAREDTTALRRAVTRNVLRVLPAGVSRGRDAVVAQYRRQFDGRVRGYELSNLQARGGTAGRATGDYRVDRAGAAPIRGKIVFGVVRDRGQPRIALIAATPSS